MHSLYYGSFGALSGVVMVLWWVLIIVLIVAAVRWMHGSTGCCGHYGKRHGSDAALDLLRERFAKGEIEKKEFEERKKALQD